MRISHFTDLLLTGFRDSYEVARLWFWQKHQIEQDVEPVAKVTQVLAGVLSELESHLPSAASSNPLRTALQCRAGS